MFKQKERNKKLLLIQIILVLLGSAALIYYIMILSILGFRRDFSLVWPLGALCCYGICFLLYELSKNSYAGMNKVLNSLLILLILGVVVLGCLEGLIIKTGYTEPAPEADYLIVLGAQVNGTRVSKALRYRLDAAYDYAVKNENARIIVSGGQGYKEDITEASAMADYLIHKGLAADRIYKEEQSTNTNENIEFSKNLLGDADYVVVVTNRFHLYRGLGIARKQLSQKVEGLGADTGTLLFLNYYVREAFAIVKDKLMRNI